MPMAHYPPTYESPAAKRNRLKKELETAIQIQRVKVQENIAFGGPKHRIGTTQQYDVAFKNAHSKAVLDELIAIYDKHFDDIKSGVISTLPHVTGSSSTPPSSAPSTAPSVSAPPSTVGPVITLDPRLINILEDISKSKDSTRRTHLRAIGYDPEKLKAMTSDELAERLKAYELATGSSGEYSGTNKGMTMQDRLKLNSVIHRPDWAYGESEAPTLPTTAELIKKYNKRLNIPPGSKIQSDGTETFGGDKTIFLNDLNAFERFALLHYDDRPEVVRDRNRLLGKPKPKIR